MSNIDKSLFDTHQGNNGTEQCPSCDGLLTIKNSKQGPFLGCSNYPICTISKPLVDYSVNVIKDIDDSLCPECGSGLQIKKGRFGLFIGCSSYPSCTHISSTQEKTEAVIGCPSCKNGQLVEKTNRYGKRFFSCTDYPKCRYVINFAPVDKPCPECDWPILVLKSGRIQCPQKTCRYCEEDGEATR